MSPATEQTVIKDVPPQKVGTKVQQVIKTGATKVECTQQDDGKWTIRAT